MDRGEGPGPPGELNVENFRVCMWFLQEMLKTLPLEGYFSEKKE